MLSIWDHSACKCALGSERMVHMLVKRYDAIIKFNHYPERWLKKIDVIIEKGKGPRIKKIRILEMIEVGVQQIMRIFFGNRMNNNVEEDNILYAYNYGYRK